MCGVSSYVSNILFPSFVSRAPPELPSQNGCFLFLHRLGPWFVGLLSLYIRCGMEPLCNHPIGGFGYRVPSYAYLKLDETCLSPSILCFVLCPSGVLWFRSVLVCSFYQRSLAFFSLLSPLFSRNLREEILTANKGIKDGVSSPHSSSASLKGSMSSSSLWESRADEIASLVAIRNEKQQECLQCIREFLWDVQEIKVWEFVNAWEHEDLPQLEALLAMVSPSPTILAGKSTTEMIAVLKRLPEFHNQSVAQLQELIQAVESLVKQLQDALIEAASFLFPEHDPLAKEKCLSLNKLLQLTEAAAQHEICWVNRHAERCWELAPILVRAGGELRRKLHTHVADGHRLLLLGEYYTKLGEELSTLVPPTATGLHEATSLLTGARRSCIQKKAELEVSELSDDTSMVQRTQEELAQVRRNVQEYQIQVEREMSALAFSAATHYPELPLQHSEIALRELMGRSNIDGLWLKGRRVEDYDEEARLTGGTHMVIVASFANKRCALKEYNVGASAMEALRNELLVLSRLRHPNIIVVEAVIMDTKKFRTYVQMPYYCGGTMTSMSRGHILANVP